MPYRNLEIAEKKSIYELKGVYYLNEPDSKDIETERLYLGVRAKEGRIYTDEEVKNLPLINKAHRYYNEWKIRSAMAKKLCSLLVNELSHKSILEIGCGNGWLSSMLAEDASSSVIGLDINRSELEQGARIFNEKKNLIFTYGDIFNPLISGLRFDYIILASSASYFNNPESLINRLLILLNEQGEIHFIDNPSYYNGDKESAKQKTEEYYESLGFPQMSRYYHHHDLIGISQKYKHRVLYNPEKIINRVKRKITGNVSPFFWILIQK